MRVPDEADPMALDIEAQLGLKRREDVLPDRITRARVEQTDRLLQAARLEPGEVLAGLGGDRLLRPPRRQLRPARELLERQRAATPRSWLPARQIAACSRARSTHASGSAPYPTRSPRHHISSHPAPAMSWSTASKACRFPCTSDTTAIRITTVCRVKRCSRIRVLAPLLLAGAAAESAARVLTPGEYTGRAAAVDPPTTSARPRSGAGRGTRARRCYLRWPARGSRSGCWCCVKRVRAGRRHTRRHRHRRGTCRGSPDREPRHSRRLAPFARSRRAPPWLRA